MLYRDERPFLRERLRYDGKFRAEMQFCNTAGIPHSQFLDWDQTDQNKVLAYLFEDSLRCGMCGTADWEWEKEDENGLVKPIRAYEPVGHFCMGCYLKSVAGEENGNDPGYTVQLVHTDSLEAAKNLVTQERNWEMRMSDDD